MAVTEERRHRLYTKLEGLIGEEDASTMMELVPPVGWGEVATKRDLDNLAAATKRDLDNLAAATKRDLDSAVDDLRREIRHVAETSQLQLESFANTLRTEWSRQGIAMIISIVTANTAMTALIVSVAKIAG